MKVGAVKIISYLFNYMEETEGGRVCTKCGEWQTYDNFRHRTDRDAYNSQCLECEREIRIQKYRRAVKPGTEYWLILDKPGDFRSIEEQQNVAKVMKIMGWEYEPLLKVWTKKGMKEVHDGRVVWLNIDERKDKVVDTTYYLKKKFKKKQSKELPSYEELIKQVRSIGYVGTSKIYGVSDNTIRNWLQNYINENENL